MSSQSPTGYTVTNVFQTSVDTDHFIRHRLQAVISTSDPHFESRQNHLCMVQCFEERCNSHQTNVIVPHHSPFLAILAAFTIAKRVVEDCSTSVSTTNNGYQVTYLRSSFFLFSKGSLSSHCCKECAWDTLRCHALERCKIS